MKRTILIMMLLLSVVLVACTAPPEDVPSAQVVPNAEDTTGAPATEQNTVPAGEGDREVVEGEEDPAPTTPEDEEVASPEESTSRAKAIDTDASTFTFEGFAVGKSHEGTFDDWRGELYYNEDGDLTGASGVIQTASVNTGIGGLDAHLQRDDFFDVAVYPEITITSTEIGSDSITAELTFRGVTKTIQFPAEVSNDKISADFTLDTTDFAMTNAGVNKEVRIAFEFVPAN